MLWEQQLEYASLSDVGMKRQNNQDSVTISMELERDGWERYGHLFVVADGMGGHAVGELASKMAIDTLPLTYKKSDRETMAAALTDAMQETNAAIHERGSLNHDFQRMGTTCSALVLGPEGALIGHVGDSRVYRVRNGRIDQLTFDHSLQWEKLRRGEGPPEEIFLHHPKNIITRSMGPEPQVQVDLEGPYPVLPGDAYIVCSDGLTNHVKDEEIGLAAQELSAAAACRYLVNLANLRGGNDNITVAIAKVGAIPEGAQPSRVRRDPTQGGELSGLWLGIAWIVAAFFCLGTILALTGHVIGGLTIALGAVVAAGILLIRWKKTLPPARASDNSRSTILWRPYRNASAKLTRAHLNDVIQIQSRMYQVAEDEQWEYDRQLYQKLTEDGQAAIAAKAHREAYRNFTQAIDALMSGLKKRTRKKTQDSKLFRLPPAASQQKN
jgi:protein phosphatase